MPIPGDDAGGMPPPPGGGAPMPGGPDAGPGGGGPPSAPPGSPPGVSPATSPGMGMGKQMAAMAAAKMILEKLHLMLGVFEPGDKKYQAILKSVNALSSAFGGEEGTSMMPMAALQAARKGGQGQAPAVPPGMGAPKPPMPQMGAPGMGM